jgi:excisionase family DNA binding protein
MTATEGISGESAVLLNGAIAAEGFSDTGWMTSREAAKHLKLEKANAFKTVERYARDGKIPAYFRLNRWYFSREELDTWLKSGVCSASQSVRVN